MYLGQCILSDRNQVIWLSCANFSSNAHVKAVNLSSIAYGMENGDSGQKLKGAFYFEDFFKCMLESFNDLPVAILSPLPFTIAFHPLLFLLSQQLNDLLIPLPRSLNNLVRHAPPFTFMSRWAALQAFLEPMRCQPVAKELLVERRL